MIETIDQQLKDWVNSTTAGTDVHLNMPPAEVDRPTVFLHLYEIDQAIPSRRDGPKPIELVLNYLVTTRAAEVSEAHKLFSEVLFAALESPELEVDVKPLPLSAWHAFGLAPQPAFKVSVTLVRERPTTDALITEPVQAELTELRRIEGVVLSTSGIPISQARIEVPGTKVSTYTDRGGRFSLRTVPALTDKKALKIVARGLEQVVSKPLRAGEPLVIRFQPQEK